MYKDKEGRYRTMSLFRETITQNSRDSGYTPVYTIKDEDKVTGLPSFKRAFILSEDPTGYTTAMELLGSWQHWVKLFDNKIFRAELTQWQEELDVRLRSKAIKALTDTALTEGSKGTAAARYIADGQYNGRARGRPTKADVARERKVQAGVSRELAEDQERVLRMVNRNK